MNLIPRISLYALLRSRANALYRQPAYDRTAPLHKGSAVRNQTVVTPCHEHELVRKISTGSHTLVLLMYRTVMLRHHRMHFNTLLHLLYFLPLFLDYFFQFLYLLLFLLLRPDHLGYLIL